MKLVHKYPILGSSANQEEVSKTIKGILILLIPMIVRITGVDIPQDSIFEIIDIGLAFWGCIEMMIGLGRKLYYKISEIL